MSLVIVKPVVISDAMMVESNVPVDDYPAYSASTQYNVGDRVVVGRRIYESTKDENTGNDPEVSPTDWLSPGFVNRWLAFDDKISTRTKQANNITYKIKTNRANSSVGVLNLIGATAVTVRVIDPVAGIVYEHSENVSAITPAPSWWHWFYGVRKARKQALFFELPAYPRADIEIVIEGGAQLGVGLIVLGQQRLFGVGVEYGPRLGYTSYSRVRRDANTGEVEINRGRSSKRSNLSLVVKNEQVDETYDFMNEIDSTPVLMVASSKFRAMSDYGLIKHFEVTIPGPSLSTCSIEFDGFI